MIAVTVDAAAAHLAARSLRDAADSAAITVAATAGDPALLRQGVFQINIHSAQREAFRAVRINTPTSVAVQSVRVTVRGDRVDVTATATIPRIFARVFRASPSYVTVTGSARLWRD
ncbi:MAG: hypothetical protein KatS3mg008_0516 [Acidimicrobiales bacterium]|nr:MAG: hypothetical protein KatS3mg008_0516 [Acidimicrobiales bacterium]